VSLLNECLNRFGFEPKGIIHVGAHVGSELSEYIALHPALLVWVEADPKTFELLKENVGAAGISGIRQIVINALITDEDGVECEFYRFSNAGGSSSIFHETPLLRDTWPGLQETGEVLRLPSRRLETVLAEQKISPGQTDVLVLDLQGAELMALKGAGPFLGSAQFLCVEVSEAEFYLGGALADDIEDFLTALGFERITPLMRHADVIFRRVQLNRWEWASTLSDEEWCRFLAGYLKAPPLPSPEFQRTWVGAEGLATFTEGMRFARTMTRELAVAGFPLRRSTRTLDFGCGWGRLYRLLMRNVDFLVGADSNGYCITLCRQMLPDGRFVQIGFRPPYEFEVAAFDVVYTYALFIHLPEKLFADILQEFARIVAPGGFVAFDLVPTFFIDQWAVDANFVHLLAKAGFDREEWKRRAEAGEFLFLGGGGESMTEDMFGWAVVSRTCLARVIEDMPFEIIANATPSEVPEFVLLRRTIS
jgi:FkbM family methyltransferase